MLQIYDSLSRSKRPFTPVQPGKVGLYVCGMTVYDWCHLGHARMLVSFDVVQRWLRCEGYQVTYVRNITDIDDKIIKRAVESNRRIGEVTEFFIDAMHADEHALGVQAPDHQPRATEYVGDMLDIIGKLEKTAWPTMPTMEMLIFPFVGFPGMASFPVSLWMICVPVSASR